MNLRGGVLIIGSLYWQNDLNPGDDKRNKWRCDRLNMPLSLAVKAPIRYGRFSKKGGEIYTMIFDNKLKAIDYGAAKVVPFRKSIIQSFPELKLEVEKLSHVEGPGRQFIKGSKNDSIAWCVCTILFNPKVNAEKKSKILKGWDVELKKNNLGFKEFIKNPKLYSVKKTGELDIPWPEHVKDLDFIIATATKPKNRGEGKDTSPDEISKFIYSRAYFHPNIQHGISTYQDKLILDIQNERISKCMSDIEKILFACPRYLVTFDNKWPDNYPDEPGVYIIFDKEEWIYFGETGNIKKRMKDLRRTVNHSLRRTLGFKLFGEKATTKIKFSDAAEVKLNKYFEQNISVACLVQKFGRLETEEYLVDKYQDQLYNKKTKRK